MIDRSDRYWYLDAVIYQLHVKAFFDSNGDGVGDFRGLATKLDYLQSLGVTALWLLPFYPSPLRDDGYDIADYRGVHPLYGNLKDVRSFIRAAHERGLRVITELVVNHTSDQHPWFQRARRAKPGSAARDFYVWSTTNQRYLDTRIIFLDTESSNWTWDPVAEAYFWHRFYSHQPDLNFDNPAVLRAVLGTMRFWLDEGVDGLRLDAVPYLIEREGTNNENLSETHTVLKRIRAELDRHYSDRMLLAEANQWPEDVRPYFGDGDECHMSFHFPLMPRMYLALMQEDRHPVTDILRQTPDIPEGCQWAIFLRNHDELTLEMVTDRERDSLWSFYATDRRMRINLGIRRRLAPLMENDRRRIELMTSLLLSMPGTPVLYYGDEIGMGDNIYLGDRDGVRTPMQWSPDRNGGFSIADPARLYLPPIMDPIYGYQAVNVEAQARSPGSLLNWMRRMIAVRQQSRAFGRGRLRFLYPGNRKILAYLREYTHADGAVETMLCVANVSRTAQAVELDLKIHKGTVPVELTGRTLFPPVGDLPYLLTLPPYGFYWFALSPATELPSWHQPLPEPMPELFTLVLAGAPAGGWADVLRGGRAARDLLEILPAYLPKQRWFPAKDRPILHAESAAMAVLPGGTEGWLIGLFDIRLAGDGVPTVRCFLPLGTSWDENAGAVGSPLLPFTIARARRGRKEGAVVDAMADPRFPIALVEAIAGGQSLATADGVIRFTPTVRLDLLTLPPDLVAARVGGEQSNSSVMVGDRMMVKAYRRLTPGVHPELEIGRYLTDVARYPNTPALLGTIEHVTRGGEPTALAIVQEFVRNQGDGWSYTLSYLDRALEDAALAADGAGTPTDAAPPAAADHGVYKALADRLGRRLAELHAAFALSSEDPAFAPEPMTQTDIAVWTGAVRHQVRCAFDALAARRGDLPGGVADDVAGLLPRLDEAMELVAEPIALGATPPVKTRTHGDLHLGQVLRAGDDWMIIDFEGEPAKTVAERRAKQCPLRDVAGMLRSFDYVAWASLFRLRDRRDEVPETLTIAARAWQAQAEGAFLEAYLRTVAGTPGHPPSEALTDRLLTLFLLEKAAYEITYEAANRPSWLCIPIRGLATVLDRRRALVGA